MNDIVIFFETHGIQMTLIAILGIIILGILKYGCLFKKINEKKRHYAYLGISIGFSVLACIIYLLVIGEFQLTYFFIVTSSIYALNQTFYNIFKVTPINELGSKLLSVLFKKCE